MNTMRALMITSMMFLMAACATRTPAHRPGTPKERIGVYDSRAVAIAYAGSPFGEKWITDLKAGLKAAETSGDEEAYRKLGAEAEKRQKRMHMQAFSTAPVDEILELIKDELPVIARNAGVGPLISKWDKEALAKHPGAEQVDVTMELVRALKPNERQLSFAKGIMETEPVPLEEVEKMHVNE